MAIRVKHDPSAAAIGESAYTMGRGEKRRWLAELAQRQQALNLQARGQELGAERSGEQLAQQQDALEFRKEQDLADREAAELERATAERRWQEEPSRQLQKGLQQQKLLQKNLAWQYDEGQKREMAKITTGIAWVREQVASGKWTAEQGEQAEQQLWQKYHSVIPLPVYDDKAKPQEMYNSRIVTDPITGARSMMDAKGDFKDAPGAVSFKDYSTLFADISAQYTTKDKEGNPVPPDSAVVHEAVMGAITRFSQIQGLAAKTEQVQQQQQQTQQQQPVSQEQQVEMQAAVEALPVMFETIIKGQPKIGRMKKGKTSGDMVYGEEAYNKTLMEAAERGKQEGIPPDAIKAELDKWWDAQHDKERGQMFQKFENRMEFKKASPEKRAVTPEVDMEKLDEFALSRIKSFKSGKIVWTSIRKRYGQETADELKYIVDSGNEQAIANALRRLGII